MALIVDAGALSAQADRNDPDHTAVVRTLQRERGALVTSQVAAAEADHLILTRLGVDVELAFLDDLATGTFQADGLGVTSSVPPGTWLVAAATWSWDWLTPPSSSWLTGTGREGSSPSMNGASGPSLRSRAALSSSFPTTPERRGPSGAGVKRPRRRAGCRWREG